MEQSESAYRIRGATASYLRGKWVVLEEDIRSRVNKFGSIFSFSDPPLWYSFGIRIKIENPTQKLLSFFFCRLKGVRFLHCNEWCDGMSEEEEGGEGGGGLCYSLFFWLLVRVGPTSDISGGEYSCYWSWRWTSHPWGYQEGHSTASDEETHRLGVSSQCDSKGVSSSSNFGSQNNLWRHHWTPLPTVSGV